MSLETKSQNIVELSKKSFITKNTNICARNQGNHNITLQPMQCYHIELINKDLAHSESLSISKPLQCDLVLQFNLSISFF